MGLAALEILRVGIGSCLLLGRSNRHGNLRCLCFLLFKGIDFRVRHACSAWRGTSVSLRQGFPAFSGAEGDQGYGPTSKRRPYISNPAQLELSPPSQVSGLRFASPSPRSAASGFL